MSRIKHHALFALTGLNIGLLLSAFLLLYVSHRAISDSCASFMPHYSIGRYSLGASNAKMVLQYGCALLILNFLIAIQLIANQPETTYERAFGPFLSSSLGLALNVGFATLLLAL